MHYDKFMTLCALESLCPMTWLSIKRIRKFVKQTLCFLFIYVYVTHFLQLRMTYKGVLKPYQASIVGLFVQKIVQNTSEASL